MEIIRHAGYVEIKLPELFDIDPRIDNISRTFTAIQPGTTKLLIDVSEHQGQHRRPDESDILHLTRTIGDALESMSDSMEMIALLARANQAAYIQPYVSRLEHRGYDIRLFTHRDKAIGWVGRN